MHWGEDPVMEKHYVPRRLKRTRSVLTFFAQDSGTHNLVYAGADISKATQNREVLAFCDHWEQVSGAAPAMLVLDQRVTTHKVLDELDQRGVKFLTLRMRSPSLVRHIDNLPPTAYTTITLDRDAKHRKPKVCEELQVKLTDYPGTVRQLIVTGLGHDTPTVIITNDRTISVKALIERYARRMTIEQRLAEAIRSFHLDALSSAVPLNVDLDVALSVLAGAVCAALRRRLPGYHTATPTPCNDTSWASAGRSSTTASSSPSASTGAPTHPSSAPPTCPPSPSPGGAAAPSATSSPKTGPVR